MNTRALTEQWFDRVWSQRNPDAIAELMDKDAEIQTESEPLHGAAGFRAGIYEPFIQAFPDLMVELDGITAEGDEAAIRWTVVGTHLGEFAGIKATGKPIRFSGMSWAQFQDGKIVRADNVYNLQALIQFLSEAAPTLPRHQSAKVLA